MTDDDKQAYVIAWYSRRYGNKVDIVNVILSRMNKLIGYGDMCNTATVKDGINAIYNNITAVS